MSGSRLVLPSQQPVQSTGLPYAGGQLFFYVSGTSTPTPTYQDYALTTPNTNPVILDSAGDAGNVFLSQGVIYKIVLEDANGNQIWTFDPVYPFAEASNQGPTNTTVRYAATGGVDTATSSDYLIKWNYTFTGNRTQIIPGADTVETGFTLIIKDILGNAFTSNIIVSPSSGTIDLASNYPMTLNKQAIMIVADATANDWSIVG